MSKLWEIGAELDTIGTYIIEAGGEISDGLQQMLDDVEMEFTEKATRIALLIRQFEADAAAAKMEEDRLEKIRKSSEKSAKRLKDYLKHSMIAFEFPFIKSPRARVRIQSNTQPSIRFADGVSLDDVDPKYRKTVETLDKAAVVRAFDASAADRKEKTAPDGFVVEYGQHVRIY